MKSLTAGIHQLEEALELRTEAGHIEAGRRSPVAGPVVHIAAGFVRNRPVPGRSFVGRTAGLEEGNLLVPDRSFVDRTVGPEVGSHPGFRRNRSQTCLR
jgi:hypothetical protein